MGKFTLGWKDIYFFLRCPKILAFNEAGFKTKEIRIMKKPLVQPNIVGAVGEKAVSDFLGLVTAGFSSGLFMVGDFLKGATKTLYHNTLSMVGKKTIFNDEIKKELLHLSEKTVKGIVEVGKHISEKYGALELVGEGEAKSPILPASVFPDRLFKVAGKDKYVLVEVKNVKKIRRENRFQASFYASLMPIGGLAVKHIVQLDTHEPSLAPIYSVDGKLDVLIVDPQLGYVEEIKPLEIDLTKIVRNVWEAKILGMYGKQPDTPRNIHCKRCRWKDYCSHYRRARESEVGSIDTIPRSPYLLFAEATLELGFSLDLLWFYQYLFPIKEKLIASTNGWKKILYRLFRKDRRNLLAETLSSLLGIDTDYANELASMILDYKKRTFVSESISKHVAKEFQEDLEAWSTAVGKKPEEIVEKFRRKIFLSIPKRIALPNRSELLLNQARKIWNL